MGESGDREWLEDPLLPELPAPPFDRIQVRGARLVRVYDEPGTRRQDGGREAVIVAWAQLPDGGWAVLLAWASLAKLGIKTTALARWCWCRLIEDRVKPVRPKRGTEPDPDQAWHGWFEPGELSEAIWQAAATLPERLRKAAVTPAPEQGPQN